MHECGIIKRVTSQIMEVIFMPKNTKEVQERYNEKRRTERKLEAKSREEIKEKLDAYAGATRWKEEKTKARSWAFILYPESAPENWKEILQKTGVAFAISPLHDSDKDPTEEDKKAHWHVIAQWGNTTTGLAVRRITDSVNAPVPIPLNAVKGYYRYFTHKDNPEKFQYDEKDIQTINGFDISEYVKLTENEIDMIKRELQEFIECNNVIEYCDLMNYLLHEGLFEKHSVASRNTYFFDKYISSRRNKQKEALHQQNNIPPNIDPETGEILS